MSALTITDSRIWLLTELQPEAGSSLVINNSDGTVSFQSRANNKYLCAVFDDTDKENPVIARSNAIGTRKNSMLKSSQMEHMPLRHM